MAAPVRVQSKSNTALLATISGTLDTNPIQGNFLLATVTSDVGITSTSITGWTDLGSVAVGLAGGLSLFAKIAGATESGTITAAATLATFMDIHLYEYKGIDTTNYLGSLLTVADTGSGVTSRSAGTTAIVVNAPSLTFACTAQALTNGGSPVWTNNMSSGLTTTHLLSSDLVLFSSEAQNTTASWVTSQRAAGLIATFNAVYGNSYWRSGR